MVWRPKPKRSGVGLLEMSALPKSIGGWGLKNPFLFSKDIVAKNVWRLIQGTCLWAWVVIDKYISHNIVKIWIKSPIKR